MPRHSTSPTGSRHDCRHAALRDRERKLPFDEIELFSSSGLWHQVIAIVSQADPSLGQIPQNHYCLIEDIRLEAMRKALLLRSRTEGHALWERVLGSGRQNVLDIQTRVRDGDAFVLNSRKFYSTGTLFAHWIPVLALDSRTGRARVRAAGRTWADRRGRLERLRAAHDRERHGSSRTCA